ncbi:hypothetical protein FRC19_001261 [Serendipita sp. 401]|nr:hypothetical protein FRC19_001261 [Serendipita sp. 401]
MVPTAPPKEPNGPPMVHVLPMGIPPPPSFTAVPPPLPLQSQPIPGFQSQPPPLQQMRNDPRAQPPYGIASGMDTGWNAPPPPVQMQLPPPVAQPPPPQAIPALVQGLSEADRNMVLAALSMSPAQIDALPPQKRAIIMQLFLVCVLTVPKRKQAPSQRPERIRSKCDEQPPRELSIDRVEWEF